MLFYLAYNISAIAFLLFRRFDLVYANDLDTLLAGGLVSCIKCKKLVYDSHELYTELPELVNRRFKRKLWQILEKIMLKKVDIALTVSHSVALELKSRYGKNFVVVRNLPISKKMIDNGSASGNIIFYQGALNIGRGLEKLIVAMQYVDNARLVIAGSGDVEKELISLTSQLGLSQKVHFTGRLSPENQHSEVSRATIGVSLEENLGLNYQYALPNKLFDYIQAGVPVLVSDMPEMQAIVEQYEVGQTISSYASPAQLAEHLVKMLADNRGLQQWRDNALKAAKELCWEHEKLLFLAALHGVVA
jgi:glycosyltransferase involved in cell wall biosynthesis